MSLCESNMLPERVPNKQKDNGSWSLDSKFVLPTVVTIRLPLILVMLSVNAKQTVSGDVSAVQWDTSVCRAARSSPEAGTLNTFCNLHDIPHSWYCVKMEAMQSEMRACKTVWVDSPMLVKVYCTAMGMTLWNWDTQFRRYIRSTNFSSATCHDRLNHHAERIISLCSMSSKLSHLYCANGTCCALPGYRNQKCRHHLLRKLFLFLLAHPLSPDGANRYPFKAYPLDAASAGRLWGCWEEELKDESHSLYTPGKWDIDSICVDTLKDLGSRVAQSVFVDVLPHWPFHLKPKRPHVGYNKRLTRLVATFLQELTSRGGDGLLQHFVYPVFERFKHTALLRSHATSGNIIVSCSGLLGKRTQVYSTGLRLLRLVIVHEIATVKYKLPRFAFVVLSTLNTFLPCALHRLFVTSCNSTSSFPL